MTNYQNNSQQQHQIFLKMDLQVAYNSTLYVAEDTIFIPAFTGWFIYFRRWASAWAFEKNPQREDLQKYPQFSNSNFSGSHAFKTAGKSSNIQEVKEENKKLQRKPQWL